MNEDEKWMVWRGWLPMIVAAQTPGKQCVMKRRDFLRRPTHSYSRSLIGPYAGAPATGLTNLLA